MLLIDFDAARLARDLNAKAARIEPAAEKALDRVAQIGLQAKARQVQKTYARAIPKRKNGKPKWTRSGAFQRGQSITRGRLKRTIETVGNAVKYEGRLAELPVSPDGVNRRNEAAQKAFDIVSVQIETVFNSELQNALRD